MKTLFLLAFLFLTVIQTYSQSAWNQKNNEGFFKLSETIIVSDQFYDKEGEIIPIRTTGVYITSLYGEYGISDKLTGFIYIPFFFRNTLNEQQLTTSNTVLPGDESNSIGDTNFGISYGLKQSGSFVVNASLLLGLPIGETEGGNTELLQSGDGEFNQMIKISAGYSFYPKPFYATGSFGINNRTNGFSDELHLSLEAGITIKKNLNIAYKIYILNSFENGEEQASQTGIFSNDTEYFALGPEFSYTVKDKYGLSFTIQGAQSGKNILANPSYSIGVFYKLK